MGTMNDERRTMCEGTSHVTPWVCGFSNTGERRYEEQQANEYSVTLAGLDESGRRERGALYRERERRARTVILAAHFRISAYVLYYILRDQPRRILTSLFSIHYSRFSCSSLPCPQGWFGHTS